MFRNGMFGYYAQLALRSFNRNRVLTALMVLAIALGIGAAMTTLTVFHVLSADPLPGKSAQTYSVALDAASMDNYRPGAEPDLQLTRFDGEALLRAGRGQRQAMMAGGSVAVVPQQAQIKPYFVDARYASSDFLAMFDAPLRHGHGWSAQDDANAARLAVIGRQLNDKLFGGANSVGRTLRLNDSDFRVIGVLDTWRPGPRVYDLTGAVFEQTEQVFVPFSTSRALKLGRQGSVQCWGDDYRGESEDLNAPCAWTQFWVQLDTPAQARSYRDFLVSYSEQQRASGRFERPANVRLRNVSELLDYRGVVPSDVKLQLWLAFGFLLVCLLNTAGLLLAKFLRRSGEIGVRRALGASRGTVLAQHLIEAGAVGLAGGIGGLGLAALGLWAVRQQPSDYADLARFDPLMLLVTFVLAVSASVLAGLLPSWRACQVPPALQLKTQ